MVNHLLMKFKYNSSKSREIWRNLARIIGNLKHLQKKGKYDRWKNRWTLG
jgi:hypothetical protein